MNLQEIFKKHEAWLKGEPGGEKAHLMGADLRGANLMRANLTDANLKHSNLTDADLEGANLKHSNLMRADLEGADLTGADLRCADLEGVNLQGANLWNTIGNGREIKSAQLERWNITWTHDRLQIGCENHAIEDWWGFSDEQISEMDPYALEWWGQNKDLIMHLVKSQSCN